MANWSKPNFDLVIKVMKQAQRLGTDSATCLFTVISILWEIVLHFSLFLAGARKVKVVAKGAKKALVKTVKLPSGYSQFTKLFGLEDAEVGPILQHVYSSKATASEMVDLATKAKQCRLLYLFFNNCFRFVRLAFLTYAKELLKVKIPGVGVRGKRVEDIDVTPNNMSAVLARLREIPSSPIPVHSPSLYICLLD